MLLDGAYFGTTDLKIVGVVDSLGQNFSNFGRFFSFYVRFKSSFGNLS